VNGMKQTMSLDVQLTGLSPVMTEAWACPRTTAAIVKLILRLLLLLRRPPSKGLPVQAFLLLLLLLRRPLSPSLLVQAAWILPNGSIASEMAVSGMKQMIVQDVPRMEPIGMEAWVWQMIIAATAKTRMLPRLLQHPWRRLAIAFGISNPSVALMATRTVTVAGLDVNPFLSSTLESAVLKVWSGMPMPTPVSAPTVPPNRMVVV